MSLKEQQHMDWSRRRLDLTGQRFGKLTVVGPAENIGNRTAWLCRCDCGNTVIAKTVHLRSGHVTTCGCVGINGFLTYVDGTCVEMIQAGTVRKNNTSGVPGVDWLAKAQRWRATICFQGKRYYLGRYLRFEDAVAARKAGEEKYFKPFLEQYGTKCSVLTIANDENE